MKGLRKNGWKFILDILMALLLALMYNKRALGLAFHEIGGMALCGLFIIHKLLNWKWIKAVSTGLFSRRVPARQKLYWVLDILLFASFAYVLVSGILISKVVFPSTGGGMAFKLGHYAAAALALVLTGVHVGLHMGWIGQRMPFLRRLPVLARRGLAVLLSVAVLAFGALQLTSTGFVGWLSNIGTVFGAQQVMLAGAGPTLPQHSESSTLSTDASAGDSAAGQVSTADGTDTVVLPTDSSTSSDGAASADTAHSGGPAGSYAATDGKGQNRGGHGEGGGTGSATNVAGVLLGFMSILLACATVTAWVDGALHSLRRRRLLRAAGIPTSEA